ncbi:uncharacterized protein LOC126972188 isoform X2 [Leptidea sinapis]|uniref:uncharacterized protein LOC126972188 isoform X2 n=1 Tax=Leptidea sinapis TaxID=189913 RepID=UPI00212FC2A3|nr:uncharacterized protein LOC126972188 isoform X2 [Leptidea sinapis]
MESGVHATVPLRVGKKMRKRRELDALVGAGSRGGRLLSASSDEGEPWGRRSRRRKSRPFIRIAVALSLCVCVVSAATVMWLFVDVRRQIVSLRIEMDRVTTSSDSVGDALQVCHTAAKELRANTSELSMRLARLELDQQELSKKLEQATAELASVSDQLSAAPKLADTPRRIAELQRTVADFGSQIKGFDSSLESAHKQALTAATGLEELRNSLAHLEEKTNDTIANITESSRRTDQIQTQLTAISDKLAGRVDELQTKIADMTKTTVTAASTALPVITASSTTSSTSTTTTQGPVKPSVLAMKEPVAS